MVNRFKFGPNSYIWPIFWPAKCIKGYKNFEKMANLGPNTAAYGIALSMLVTEWLIFGENFEVLMTGSSEPESHHHNDTATNILKLSWNQ